MRYTYVCDECGKDEEKIFRMTEERPEVICVCGSPMRRRFSNSVSVAGSAFEVLTDWHIENYNRYRAGVPRFSPDTVMRPVHPRPKHAWSPKPRRKVN